MLVEQRGGVIHELLQMLGLLSSFRAVSRQQCGLSQFPGRVLAHPTRVGLGLVLRPRNEDPRRTPQVGSGRVGLRGLAWPLVLLPGERRTRPRGHYSFAWDPGRNPGHAVELTCLRPTPALSPRQRTCRPGSRSVYSEATETSEHLRIHHPMGETAVTEFDTCDIL